MKVVDIAQELFVELGQPSDLSVASLSYWARATVGQLNNMLFTKYSIDEITLEIVDATDPANPIEINIIAAAVLKKIYVVYRYAFLIRSKITAIDSDNIIEIKDQDSSVKRIDKTQLIKLISAEKKNEEEELKLMINAYRTYVSSPVHVVGDDTYGGSYPNFFPFLRSGRIYGYMAF